MFVVTNIKTGGNKNDQNPPRRLLAFRRLQAAVGHAQSSFPQRDITFIVPWNAGGSNDVAARALDPLLREQGIKIVIENVVGATGSIGMRRIASRPGRLHDRHGHEFDAGADRAGQGAAEERRIHPYCAGLTDPLLLLVPSTAPQKSLEEFIAYMKSNPDKVTIGTPGNYNINHIFASMTARAAGVNYVNVPYTGGAKVVGDLIGGHVNSGVLKPSETLGQIQENLLRPLGVFANERLEQFPDVPTFKDKGFDVFPYGPVVQMAYVVAPANLPADVRTKLITRSAPPSPIRASRNSPRRTPSWSTT